MSDQNALARYMALINDIDRMRSQLMQGGNALATYASPVSAGRFSSEGRLNPLYNAQWQNDPAFQTIGQQLFAYGLLLPDRMSQNIEDRRPDLRPNPLSWLRAEARK